MFFTNYHKDVVSSLVFVLDFGVDLIFLTTAWSSVLPCDMLCPLLDDFDFVRLQEAALSGSSLPSDRKTLFLDEFEIGEDLLHFVVDCLPYTQSPAVESLIRDLFDLGEELSSFTIGCCP